MDSASLYPGLVDVTPLGYGLFGDRYIVDSVVVPIKGSMNVGVAVVGTELP